MTKFILKNQFFSTEVRDWLCIGCELWLNQLRKDSSEGAEETAFGCRFHFLRLYMERSRRGCSVGHRVSSPKWDVGTTLLQDLFSWHPTTSTQHLSWKNCTGFPFQNISNIKLLVCVSVLYMVLVLLTFLSCYMSTLHLIHYALLLTPAC